VTTGTAADARAPGARRRASPGVSTPQYERRRRLVPVALVALLAATALASAAVGAVAISPGEVLAALVEPIGVRLPWAVSEQQAAVIWGIRLPRVALAALVGATLASAGAALQGMFRNPLADPGLIGVSSGASLAAVAVIVLGERLWGLVAGLSPGAITTLALPGAAFAGGLAATFLVLRLARVGTPADAGARSTAATMLLCGVAVNAIAGAGVGFLVYLANDQQLRDVTFWTLGSLGGATWRAVGVALPFCLAALVGLPRLAGALNLLLLGESEARHLGVHVERTKRLAMVLICCRGGCLAMGWKRLAAGTCATHAHR
jgi:iron complex transport system permease protein